MLPRAANATLRPMQRLAVCLQLRCALAVVPAVLLAVLPAAGQDSASILVFSKTAGFRHASIPDGQALIRELAAVHGFAVEETEDAGAFTDANLARFAAVVWLSTTGDVLDAGQEAAFQRYIRAGGGYVGVHAAADTEHDWPWYGELLGGGAWFLSHPPIQQARLVVEDHCRPSTTHLPESFFFTDEWYNFAANPRPSVHVLLSIDEASYSPGPDAMGDHPLAWCHAFEGGRAWITNLGHRSETWSDPRFARHLLGGILWATGWAIFSDGLETGAAGCWSGAG